LVTVAGEIALKTCLNPTEAFDELDRFVRITMNGDARPVGEFVGDAWPSMRSRP
jgi:hypothetical protein